MSVMDWVGLYNLYRVDEVVVGARVKAIVNNFPVTYSGVFNAWVKFKIGVERGLFTSIQKAAFYRSFRDIADIWDKIGLNWTEPLPGGTYSQRRLNFAVGVDQWAADVRGVPRSYGLSGLGVVPIVAIFWVAGIVALSVASIYAAKAWTDDSEVKLENSRTVQQAITALCEGKINDSQFNAVMGVTKAAADAAGDDWFTNIKEIGKYALIGAALYFAAPLITPLIGKATKALGGKSRG